ncbi:hypothetical protein ACQCSU_02185 [Pseudarthrobacter sp. O4]|uniref:hypothetical protein n=1 Tax=Pseudarthrobacter sp. O4 TaxID=3418417 RepID=UPI003CEA676B
MGRIGKTAAAALLVLALSACTGGTPDPASSPGPTAAPPATGAAPAAATDPAGQVSGEAVSLETGTDVGNGRPASSHDGLMVRRRMVIAVHPTPDADLGALRRQLDRVAAERGVLLSDISPDVLDPVVLEHVVPEVIVALPPEGTHEEADALAGLAFGPVGSFTGVEHVHVGSVLVHDLQFRIGSADPAALAETIASEGILSDALGNYSTSLDGGALTVGYTGPLLSDELVEAVREGMARGAGVGPGEVELAPRSATGEGVDLSAEPEPAETEGAHASGRDDSGH